MLNFLVEKGARKDRDQSGSSIIRPRTGSPTGFLQRSRLDFGLGTSPVDIYFLLFFSSFYFSFYFIAVALTSSPPASLILTVAVHLSIATTIYFLIFPSYYLYFYLY